MFLGDIFLKNDFSIKEFFGAKKTIFLMKKIIFVGEFCCDQLFYALYFKKKFSEQN